MSHPRSFIAATVLTATLALAACGHSYTDVNISSGGNIRLHDGYVTIQADGAREATVSANGDLRIGSREIAVNSAQRQLLRRYFVTADGIGQQGIAVGKAGAHMAGGTIGDVFRNLFSGHPDRIDADVHKRTDRLLAKVSVICDGLQSLQTTQDELAASLAAFRPYANLHASDVQDCRDGIAKGRRDVARDMH